MHDSFLTVSEVADRLRLNPQTVRNWIDRGDLPAVRVGQRRVRVRQSDLDRFLEAGATRTAQQAVRSTEAVSDLERQELFAAMESVRAAFDNDRESELADALRALAEVTTRLAEKVGRP